MKCKDGYFQASAIMNGKRVRARSRASQRDADKKLAAMLDALERGERPVKNRLTVEKWAAEWLDVYKKPKISRKEYKKYEMALRRHVYPYIGDWPLTEVRGTHAQQVLNELAQKNADGYSQSFVNFVFNLLRQMFGKAVLLELVKTDPSAFLEKPKGFAGSRRALTAEELDAFYGAAATHRFGMFLKMILACGLRPGEARALRWENIDLNDGVVHVVEVLNCELADILVREEDRVERKGG